MTIGQVAISCRCSIDISSALIYLGPIISKTAGDMPMEHRQEMATWESNGHVTDGQVTLKGQGRDPNSHLTSSVMWPFEYQCGPLEPSLYLQPFSRYWAISILVSRPWPFRVTWRHQSCDYSHPNMPFPIGVFFGSNFIGSKSLSLTDSEILCPKPHVPIGTTLNHHCACAISHDMCHLCKIYVYISISRPHFAYSLYYFHWALMKNKGCSLRDL